MACISLEGVSHTYPGGIKAVNDLDLEVFDGELMVLLGPSGCGKSTTLRLIAGLESPSSGTIRLGDRVANRVPPCDRNVAMVFQEETLYPHLTVRGNLAFSLQARRRRWWVRRREPRQHLRKATRERVERIAKRLGLAELLERRPAALSGGERQRVALGRMLVRGAGIWLLDEPFAHLDAQLRVGLRRTLQEIHQDAKETAGATVLYVTHDQSEALAAADRIAVMRHGAIVQCGAPREVYERPANVFVAGFLGDPPMNLAAGSLVENAEKPCIAGSGWSLEIDNARAAWLAGNGLRNVIVGIRPQHVMMTCCHEEPLAPGMTRMGTARVRLHEFRGDTEYTVATPRDDQGDGEYGDATWWGRAVGAHGIASGTRVQLWTGVERIVLFDARDGRCIDGIPQILIGR